MKEEVSELDGKIVQSPERIKRDTEKMETDIQQLKVNVSLGCCRLGITTGKLQIKAKPLGISSLQLRGVHSNTVNFATVFSPHPADSQPFCWFYGTIVFTVFLFEFCSLKVQSDLKLHPSRSWYALLP